jgi:hypothetical protein
LRTPPAPCIAFDFNVKNMDKVDSSDADKSKWIKLELFIDPDNPASKFSQHFAIFKDECPEKWIKWVMAVREIENLMPLKQPADKTRMFQIMLKGSSLVLF